MKKETSWILQPIFVLIVCIHFSITAQSVTESKEVEDPKEIYAGIKNFLENEYKQGTYQKAEYNPKKTTERIYRTYKGFTSKAFMQTAGAFVKKSDEVFKEKNAWLSGGTKNYLFVRKLVLPADSIIEFRGDLHGDALSLIHWLDSLRDKGWFDKDNPFKLIKKNYYLAFLGDYTDRGIYGSEVMFIIMQLYLHNPDNVLIVRGNHEDANIIQEYGFSDEFMGKFTPPKTDDIGLNLQNAMQVFEDRKWLVKVYDYMPVALFLGCDNGKGGTDFIQCCHGGMEPWYNWQPLLDDQRLDLYEWLDKKIDTNRDKVACTLKIDLHDQLAKCPCSKQNLCTLNGFQWNDFDFFNEKPDALWEMVDGRGRLIHKKLATQLFERKSKNRVWSVLRAHQHNHKTIGHILGYGNGLYRLWSDKVENKNDWGSGKDDKNVQWTGKDGDAVALEKYSVWTFNVAPRTGYYEKDMTSPVFDYDTVARLELKKGFDNWLLYPRQIPVI